MDTFNYKVKISLKTNILSRYSSNLNNELDIVNAGRMFNHARSIIVFKFFLEKIGGNGITSDA